MTDHSMKELLALAERCEKATGPDRELDYAIIKAVGWSDERPYRAEDSWREPLNLTASLDAAMTLVPEGWDWCAGTGGNGAGGHAFLRIIDGQWTREIECDAATPALALCAAALRARASGGNQS